MGFSLVGGRLTHEKLFEVRSSGTDRPPNKSVLFLVEILPPDSIESSSVWGCLKRRWVHREEMPHWNRAHVAHNHLPREHEHLPHSRVWTLPSMDAYIPLISDHAPCTIQPDEAFLLCWTRHLRQSSSPQNRETNPDWD